MRDIVLISVGNDAKIGVYAPSLSNEYPILDSYVHVRGMASRTLPFLFGSIFKRGVLDSQFSDASKPAAAGIESGLTGVSGDLSSIAQTLGSIGAIKSICYARGVGSLSAIKLTHVFLRSLSISANIPLFAKNTFYFAQDSEIFAFGGLSFFLKRRDVIITDENAREHIYLAKSVNPCDDLILPNILKHSDFNETCSPLYITPPL